MRMGGFGQLDGWETPRDFAKVYGLEVGKPRCMEWLAGQVVSLRLDRDRGQPFSGRFEMQCSQSFGKD